MRKQKLNQTRIIHNNDGCDASQYPVNNYANAEFSISDFLNSRSVGLIDSDVTTISYCSIASSFGQYSHNTKVGEFLTKPYQIKPGKVNVVPEFIKLGTDPLEVTCNFAHENGFEFFWSNRINDTHDHPHRQDNPYVKWSKLKNDHPEFLFGKIGEDLPYGMWSAVDFSLPEIRNLCIAYYTEVCENYDVDGIELDFFRSLVLFKNVARGEIASSDQLEMITDMVTKIRYMTERVGMKKGKPILVLVRVPDSSGYCKDFGIDLEKWMKNGLIDIIVGSDLFRLNPWKYLVDLGHKYNAKVFAGLSESRVQEEHPLLKRQQNSVYRARAAAAWEAGVDGLYIFNEYNTRSQYLSEIGSNEKLLAKNKLYFITYRNKDPNYRLKNGVNYSALPLLTPMNPAKIDSSLLTFPIEIGNEKLPANIALILFSKEKNVKNIKVSLNEMILTYFKSTDNDLSIFKVPAESVKAGMNKVSFSYGNKQESLILHDAAILFYRETEDPDMNKLATICFNI